jgi:Glycosyl transferases group 1
MRFLLIPAEDHAFDVRAMAGLAKAFRKLGHDADVLLPIAREAPPRRSYFAERMNAYDVVLEVNYPRPEFLGQQTRYVTWLQDIIPGNENPRFHASTYASIRDGDLLYTMGASEWLACPPNFCGSLLAGVDEELLSQPSAPQSLDFSFCGYIPPPGCVSPGACARIDQLYEPLAGSLRILEVEPKLQIPGNVSNQVRDRARQVDRLITARQALSASQSCELWGNWDWHEEFRPWAKPHTDDEAVLYDIFQRSRINFHTNIFGFGLHTRVLEVMALGGFVMTHAAAEPQKAGRVTAEFEPGRHFGQFTSYDLPDQMRYWLSDDGARYAAAGEARKIVASRHLWSHRAQQILTDLAA